MDYNEALKAVEAAKLIEIKDLDALRSGLAALHLYYSNHPQLRIKAAIESFETEISRRAHLAGLTDLHQEQMAQGKIFTTKRWEKW